MFRYGFYNGSRGSRSIDSLEQSESGLCLIDTTMVLVLLMEVKKTYS